MQRRVFAINRCLLSLYMNKHKECLAALTKLEKELAASELPSLVKAALLAREKRLDECSALLQQYATANPKTALRVKLTLAQLQLQQGEKTAAIETLESIDSALSQAGIVGAIVKLYELVKNQPGAIKTLDAAAKVMEADKSKEAPALVKRYRMIAADLRMSSQDAAEALKALEALVKVSVCLCVCAVSLVDYFCLSGCIGGVCLIFLLSFCSGSLALCLSVCLCVCECVDVCVCAYNEKRVCVGFCVRERDLGGENDDVKVISTITIVM